MLAPALVRLIEDTRIDDALLAAEFRGRVLEERSPQRLVAALARTLYAEAHAGLRTDVVARPSAWSDAALEQQLGDAMPRGRSRVRAALLAETDGVVVVDLGGVHVSVAADSDRIEAREGDEIVLVVPTHWPRQSPGYFSVTSPTRGFRAIGPIVRVYVQSADAELALASWRAVGTALGDRDIPWRAKALASATSYPRNDAIVLYLPRPAWQHLDEILGVLAGTGASGGSCGAAFVNHRSPGVAVAFEPVDVRPTYAGLSFGQHRSRLVAEALVAASRDRTDPAVAVRAALVSGAVDATAPWRNVSSPMLFGLS